MPSSTTNGGSVVRWPPVTADDWCGEHQPVNHGAPAFSAPTPATPPRDETTRPVAATQSSSTTGAAPARTTGSRGAGPKTSRERESGAAVRDAMGRDASGRGPSAPAANTTRSSSMISGLTARTKKVIALLGVTTWEQLAALTAEHVRGQKGTGVGTLGELREALQERGLTFADEQDG